jgi:hypothetical protein
MLFRIRYLVRFVDGGPEEPGRASPEKQRRQHLLLVASRRRVAEGICVDEESGVGSYDDHDVSSLLDS